MRCACMRDKVSLRVDGAVRDAITRRQNSKGSKRAAKALFKKSLAIPLVSEFGEVAEWLKAPHSKFDRGCRYRFCSVLSGVELSAEIATADCSHTERYGVVLLNWVAKW